MLKKKLLFKWNIVQIPIQQPPKTETLYRKKKWFHRERSNATIAARGKQNFDELKSAQNIHSSDSIQEIKRIKPFGVIHKWIITTKYDKANSVPRQIDRAEP